MVVVVVEEVVRKGGNGETTWCKRSRAPRGCTVAKAIGGRHRRTKCLGGENRSKKATHPSTIRIQYQCSHYRSIAQGAYIDTI